MTNKQIFQKVMEKAEKNGFNFGDWVMKHIRNKYPKVKEAESLANIIWLNIDWMIYDHDFAEAFWGDSPLYCSACDRTHKTKSDCDAGFGYKDLTAWEFYLRQMVLEKEPLKYLKKFI